MSLSISPELERLFRDRMARGNFATEDELIREALKALDSRSDIVQALEEGFSDLDAGRTRPLREVDSGLRAKYGIRRDA